MEPTELTKRISLPTIQVAVAALALEVFSLFSIGKSPAYLTVTDLLNQASLSIGYFAIIFSLTAFLFMLLLIAVSMLANNVAWRVLSWPLRKVRFLRVAIQFSRRAMYVSSEAVRHYAEETNNEDLLSKLNKKEQIVSRPTSMLPLLIVVLLSIILFISSPEKPNFFMKVCSLNEPTGTCGAYYLLLVLAYFQAFIFMALYGFLLRQSFWFPRKELPVATIKVKKVYENPITQKLNTAMSTWMRGK